MKIIDKINVLDKMTLCQKQYVRVNYKLAIMFLLIFFAGVLMGVAILWKS